MVGTGQGLRGGEWEAAAPQGQGFIYAKWTTYRDLLYTSCPQLILLC